MAFHHTISETERIGQSEIAGINSAVAEHDAVALRSILSEVNRQSPRDMAGAQAVYNLLSKESRMAIKPVGAAGTVDSNYPETLEVSNIWEKSVEKK